MFNEEFDEKLSLEELQHYGVLGMKWGIRKGRDNVYSKSIKKLNKLDKKSTEYSEKSQRDSLKADFKRDKAVNLALAGKRSGKRHGRKALKLSKKAYKFGKKSTRYSKRAQKWAKNMDKYLKETTLTDVSREDIVLGRKYSLEILENYEKSKRD